jgi:hypothetical protein
LTAPHAGLRRRNIGILALDRLGLVGVPLAVRTKKAGGLSAG